MRKVRVSMEKNFMHIGWVDYRDAGDTPRFLQAEDLDRFQEFGIILLHHPCQHIACLSENDDLDVLLVATSSQKGADIPYLCIDIPIGHHCVAPSTFGYFVGNVVLEWAAPGIKSKSDPNQFFIRAASKRMIQLRLLSRIATEIKRRTLRAGKTSSNWTEYNLYNYSEKYVPDFTFLLTPHQQQKQTAFRLYYKYSRTALVLAIIKGHAIWR